MYDLEIVKHGSYKHLFFSLPTSNAVVRVEYLPRIICRNSGRVLKFSSMCLLEQCIDSQTQFYPSIQRSMDNIIRECNKLQFAARTWNSRISLFLLLNIAFLQYEQQTFPAYAKHASMHAHKKLSTQESKWYKI